MDERPERPVLAVDGVQDDRATPPFCSGSGGGPRPRTVSRRSVGRGRPARRGGSRPTPSGNLVDRQLVPDPPQGAGPPRRLEPRPPEQPRRPGIVDHRRRREDRARGGEALHARRRCSRSGRNSPAARSASPPGTGPSWMPILSSRSSLPCASFSARIASRMRSAAATARSGVGKVAITASPIVLTTAPALGGDDLVQRAEMRAHQVEGDQVADPLVELGRALEVGEQEGEAGDLEPLVDVERVGAVDVAEGLVGEQALGGQERPALAEQVVQRVVGDPDARQRRACRCGSRATAAAARAAARRSRSARCTLLYDERQVLPLARRLALDVDELRRVRHRLEDDRRTRPAAAARGCAFSPGGSSTASSVISSISRSRSSSGRSTPEPQKIWRQYSAGGSVVRDRAPRCGARAG